MMNRKILAMVGVSAMMIGLVACGSKAESNIAECLQVVCKALARIWRVGGRNTPQK